MTGRDLAQVARLAAVADQLATAKTQAADYLDRGEDVLDGEGWPLALGMARYRLGALLEAIELYERTAKW